MSDQNEKTVYCEVRVDKEEVERRSREKLSEYIGRRITPKLKREIRRGIERIIVDSCTIEIKIGEESKGENQ